MNPLSVLKRRSIALGPLHVGTVVAFFVDVVNPRTVRAYRCVRAR
jgi:hypothetical protein